MRTLAPALAAVAAALVLTVAAGAITYGVPDGDGHPEVGALLAPVAYSDGTWASCSGTLIAPKVFLTAAHCDQGVSRVAVTFDSSYDARTGKAYWGTWHADPAYDAAQSDPHDIAVVLLDKAVKGVTPARLPAAGLLDAMFANGTLQTTLFTAVGYGDYAGVPDAQKPPYPNDGYRRYAVGSFNALSPGYLRLSQNAATGDGGTCDGDSGGPNFIGAGASETNVIAAITSTGDILCKATNVDYRLDIPEARNFLRQFVALP